ncbi:GGDEF domain-containing protein [Sulfurospirillum arcachonense]|uniref:GGDEF domain-containing protein n=1 Tax=Sulfurospirillum arcachonense TaxID=57666 RepID=UPI000468CD09|nr:GGDEF domain-containing protein [Sulfurospirillum arcachonense]
MKKKLTLVILGSIFISYMILLIFTIVNMRTMGTKGAEEKAEIAAELIKTGLTSQMVNGTMQNRAYFLKKIEKLPNIESLWLTRSTDLEKQFGKGLNKERKKDSIETEVMNSGKIYKKFLENSTQAKLRVTMPYIASQVGNPNCMHCHDAKEGDVLGTVSMVIDISDIRSNGLSISLVIIVISTFMMLIVFYIINRSMNPLLSLFSSITSVMEEAKEGNYSKRVKTVSDREEYKNVTFGINSLLDKIQDALLEIEKTVDSFLTFRKTGKRDILIELKMLINEISAIHEFKKTIELDENNMQIYKRIGVILQERFKLKDFIIVEANKKSTSGPKIVFSTYEKTISEISPTCRALRTKQAVDSGTFTDICDQCFNKFKHYLCVPYVISNDLELIIKIGTNERKIIEKAKKRIGQFKDYINEARPEIVSKNLTEILKISSNTDPLTGLFNRKYLDEYIEKAIAQAERNDIHYGILMIDIDFFKVVNDTYGHDVGDIVIKELAEILKTSIRKSDIAFRFGGEEFLILLYNCNHAQIIEIAEKIRTNFEKKIITMENGKTFSKTLSVGSSIYPTDANSIWKAIKYSDIALYEAKETGRNKVVQFEQKLLKNNDIDILF